MGPTLTILELCGLLVAIVALVMLSRVKPFAPRAEAGGLADKIPWKFLVADGIVLCEGDRLLCAWEIEGADMSGLSFEEQADAVRTAAQGVMDGTGAEVVQLDWVIFRDNQTGYPHGNVEPRDPLAKAMFASRLEFFDRPGKQFANEMFLAMTWTIPNAFAETMSAIAVKNASNEDDRFTKAVAELQQIANDIETQLSTHDASAALPSPGKWKMRRLTSRVVDLPEQTIEIDGPDGKPTTITLPAGPAVVDELLQFLRRCFSRDNAPIELPATAIVEGEFRELVEPLDLEGVVYDQDLEPTFQPRIGDYYFECVQVEKFRRGGTTPNQLNTAMNLPMPLSTHIRAIAATPEEVERRASKRFAMLHANSDKRSGKRRNLASERKANTAENVDTEKDRWYHWNVKVVVAAHTRDAAKTGAGIVKKALHAARMGARIERLGNPGAIAASWPGENLSDRSESLIDQTTLLDLAPVASVYRGQRAESTTKSAVAYTGPTMRAFGLGNTPVDVYAQVEDVAHTGAIGPIGTGKSTLSNGLVYLDRATTPDTEHLIFDQGYSAQPLVEGEGGKFVDADPSRPETGDCPYDRIEEPEEREIWTKWNLDNLRLADFNVNEVVEEIMRKSMELLAKSAVRSHSLLQKKVATFDNAIAAAMTPWTMNGAGGYLFDAEFTTRSKVATDNALTCYEMSRLMRLRDDRLTGPLITMAFNRLLRRQLNSSATIRVHLDEPADYFRHPVFVKLLAEYYDKIARKNNGGVRMFTQHPQQFLSSEIAVSILAGTHTWFLFPNREAGGSLKQTYKSSFQLTDEICAQIADVDHFKGKQHVGVWQSGHFSIIDPKWQPDELAWIGATSKADRQTIARLRAAHPRTYPAKFFQHKGCPEAARRWIDNAIAEGIITDEDVRNAA